MALTEIMLIPFSQMQVSLLQQLKAQDMNLIALQLFRRAPTFSGAPSELRVKNKNKPSGGS